MAVNVARLAHTPDAGWLRALHAVVPPLVRAFDPERLFTQLGCDSHRLDPLAQLDLTIDGHRAYYAAWYELAHDVTSGRLVASVAIVDVVPRSWTHLQAEITPLDSVAATPSGWRKLARGRTGRVVLTYRAWDAGKPTRRTPSTGPSPTPGGPCSQSTAWTPSTRGERRPPPRTE